jgi:diaminohydroxyphosphoribosylaminopyrimidine deaminase/5-amino-6-(5-phosphoribosylamino)uracil reductase
MACGNRADEATFMARALALAARGEGRTRPNPPVGAVVVVGDRCVGEGWHKRAGGAHAEVVALRAAGEAARGATLFVTLEPCSTQGRTPPCTEAILAAGITRVVVATTDPNPKHRGRGLRALRRAGVAVETGLGGAAARALLAPFTKLITTGRPYLTLKLAMTLDGRIADAAGTSRWITSPASRRHVIAMRRRCDAIMVGVGTALADDPALQWSTVPSRNPYRIVLDRRGRLPLDSQLLSDSGVARSVVVVGERCPATRVRAFEGCGATVWRLPVVAGRLDLDALLAQCGRAGWLHLLSEGGGEVAASLMRAGLVDQLEMFVAPKLLGGSGVPVFGQAGWSLPEAPQFSFSDVRPVGPDIWITATPKGE